MVGSEWETKLKNYYPAYPFSEGESLEEVIQALKKGGVCDKWTAVVYKKTDKSFPYSRFTLESLPTDGEVYRLAIAYDRLYVEVQRMTWEVYGSHMYYRIDKDMFKGGTVTYLAR